MYSFEKSKQRGAVSFITVIFISILLTIMTAGFIRLAINEQREATDDDLTTRAHYAAESGVQDAIAAINVNGVTGLTNPDECLPEGGSTRGDLSSVLDTEYTCQIINGEPEDYQAALRENESVFFRLESTSDIDSFTVEWHSYGDGPDSEGLVYNLRGSKDLIDKQDWNSNEFPAMVRIQVVAIPQTGNITRSDIDNEVGFLNPHNSTSSDSPESLGAFDGAIHDGTCIDPNPSLGSGQFICSFEVDDLDDGAYNYYLRITSLYTSTHIRVTADSGVVSGVKLLNAQAIIDVTGRAGDVYRRVEKRINLENDSLWPNFAILSGEDICKNFNITDDVNEFGDLNSGVVGSCK